MTYRGPDGKQYRESCKTESKTEAMALLEKRRDPVGLKWDQIDLRHGFILLDDTKNGERREIPINETLRTALEKLPRHIISPYVFWQENGRGFLDVRRSFYSATKRSGIKDFHFHDLRHTFASFPSYG